MPPSLAPSPRSRVRRAPSRADYTRGTIDAILDEALVAHVACVVDGQPFVMPTLHARLGDEVLIHGSTASRLIRTLQAGAPGCLTVTLVDALVLARSAFHHSMNYRSVVVLGTARLVTGDAERRDALAAFTDRVVPGRSAEVRGPNRKELRATQVLAFRLDEASAKLRTGPPVDDAPDHDLDVWAGTVPLSVCAGAPLDDPALRQGIAPSEVVTSWVAARQAPART